MLPALTTLKEHVYRRGLGLRGLERLTGVCHNTASALFKGTSTARLDTLTLMAQGIGLVPCAHCGALGWREPEETNP